MSMTIAFWRQEDRVPGYSGEVFFDKNRVISFNTVGRKAEFMGAYGSELVAVWEGDEAVPDGFLVFP